MRGYAVLFIYSGKHRVMQLQQLSGLPIPTPSASRTGIPVVSPDRLKVLALAMSLATGICLAGYSLANPLPDTGLDDTSSHSPPTAEQFSDIHLYPNQLSQDYANILDRRLILAAQQGDLRKVKQSLAEGARPNSRDYAGNRALFPAASEGHLEITRLLLERGAITDFKSPDGRTPLGIAALRGHARIVRMLLKAGAAVDARSDNGMTPLLDAVQLDRTEVVKELLAFSPDLTRPTPGGLPALVLAAQTGNADIIRMLLDKGIDPDTADQDERPALFHAIFRKHRAAALLLVERGAKTGTMSITVFD